jgi:hypothetical protein
MNLEIKNICAWFPFVDSFDDCYYNEPNKVERAKIRMTQHMNSINIQLIDVNLYIIYHEVRMRSKTPFALHRLQLIQKSIPIEPFC